MDEEEWTAVNVSAEDEIYDEKLGKAMVAYREMLEAEIQMGTFFLVGIDPRDFYDLFIRLQ